MKGCNLPPLYPFIRHIHLHLYKKFWSTPLYTQYYHTYLHHKPTMPLYARTEKRLKRKEREDELGITAVKAAMKEAGELEDGDSDSDEGGSISGESSEEEEEEDEDENEMSGEDDGDEDSDEDEDGEGGDDEASEADSEGGSCYAHLSS
jgi:hypothetical protein